MIKFKEKVSKIPKMGIILPGCLVTIPFLSIVFSNPANSKFLPIVLGWCVLCVLVTIYRFNLLSTITLSDKVIFAPNRGYHRHINDVSGKVKILNGRILIPYNEITEVRVKNKKVYLTYTGLSNNVVLQPISIEQFIIALEEKLACVGVSVSIQNEICEENLLEFKNKTLTNKPTLICFAIFMLFPNIGGIVTGSGFFLTITILITIILFVAIFEYEQIIILSDEGIIETTQYGDADLGTKKIAYQDIAKITQTDWRVDIETNGEGSLHFVSEPENVKVFHSKLQEKLNNVKNIENY